ncbi:MAG: hypothetical protein FJW23_04580 [Acidimicrobiia bacterium]|nr:hypothetical protein [Acidimicrobiia bacterium]
MAVADTTLAEIFGYLAAFLTTTAFVPQVLRTWRTRSAGDLSLRMLVIFTSGIALWLVYGVLIRSAPVVAANVCTLVLNGVLIWLRLRYGSARPAVDLR